MVSYRIRVSITSPHCTLIEKDVYRIVFLLHFFKLEPCTLHHPLYSSLFCFGFVILLILYVGKVIAGTSRKELVTYEPVVGYLLFKN